jgi:NAD(P)-dependent dehydrogenase (short-subunit alcohol dehydrogenase family)
MRTVVITGANTGLGFQTALQLARTGARIVMACRNTEKAREAQRQLLAEVPEAETIIVPVDVSEPASIREFGRRVSDGVGPLDVLINNAGIVAVPLSRNSVGHELQLATNYLGPFALTGTLLPFFRNDAPARIVTVGSLAHRAAKLDLDDLNWEDTAYNVWKGYARSKLALLGFTMELSRRLKQRGSNIVAVGAHPGFAATEIGKDSPALTPTNPLSRWLKKRLEPLIPPAAQSAMSILHAAVADDVAGGDYFGPNGFLEIGGRPESARVNPIAKDRETGKRLWALSESMTGIRYLSEDDAAAVASKNRCTPPVELA